MFDVCVVGSFMMDLIVKTPRFPNPGETIAGHSLVTLPGGKGFNQAVAATRSGAKTSMLGCIGDDAFGKEFKSWMSDEKIQSDGVKVSLTSGTGVGLPMVNDSGQNAIVIVPQANLSYDEKAVIQFAKTIESSKTVVMQLEIPDEANLAAAKIAKQAGAKVILNPAPFRHLSDKLLANIDILVPNETELEQLASDLGIPTGNVELSAKSIKAKYGFDLIVTLGEEGALIVADDIVRKVSGFTVKAVDTVGAGDTFIGNLASSIARGEELENAVRRANAAAALSVTKVGGAAATPTAQEVEDFRLSTSAK